MVECTDLEGKTVRRLKIFDEPGTDPEVVIEFTDGTVFSACLRVATAVKRSVSETRVANLCC